MMLVDTAPHVLGLGLGLGLGDRRRRGHCHQRIEVARQQRVLELAVVVSATGAEDAAQAETFGERSLQDELDRERSFEHQRVRARVVGW